MLMRSQSRLIGAGLCTTSWWYTILKNTYQYSLLLSSHFLEGDSNLIELDTDMQEYLSLRKKTTEDDSEATKIHLPEPETYLSVGGTMWKSYFGTELSHNPVAAARIEAIKDYYDSELAELERRGIF